MDLVFRIVVAFIFVGLAGFLLSKLPPPGRMSRVRARVPDLALLEINDFAEADVMLPSFVQPMASTLIHCDRCHQQVPFSLTMPSYAGERICLDGCKAVA